MLNELVIFVFFSNVNTTEIAKYGSMAANIMYGHLGSIRSSFAIPSTLHKCMLCCSFKENTLQIPVIYTLNRGGARYFNDCHLLRDNLARGKISVRGDNQAHVLRAI